MRLRVSKQHASHWLVDTICHAYGSWLSGDTLEYSCLQGCLVRGTYWKDLCSSSSSSMEHSVYIFSIWQGQCGNTGTSGFSCVLTCWVELWQCGVFHNRAGMSHLKWTVVMVLMRSKSFVMATPMNLWDWTITASISCQAEQVEAFQARWKACSSRCSSLWSVMAVYIRSQISYQDAVIQGEDHADGHHLVSQIHSYRHNLHFLWLWCTNLTQSWLN